MTDICIGQIIADSGVAFGTSGARGLVSQFSDPVAGAFALAFRQALADQGYDVSVIALAIDRRPSSPAIAASIYAALKAVGCEVKYYGILPTPALALQSFSQSIPSLMVTGSHIPFERNGIKFYRPDGEIDKPDEAAILRQRQALPTWSPHLPLPSDHAREDYQARYLDAFASHALSNLTVGVYEHSAAGRDLTCTILKKLGAEVVSLGKTNQFVALDTEAISERDQYLARQWCTAYDLDAIVTTDGDGDRVMMADDEGRWLAGDVIGMLCTRLLQPAALVVPISCNSGIESYLNIPVVRTKIGSPYVIEAMATLAQTYPQVVGFEANGGFLTATAIPVQETLLAALPTRDALLPMLMVLQEINKQRVSLSALVQQVTHRVTSSSRITDVSWAFSQTLLRRWQDDLEEVVRQLGRTDEVCHVNTTDGLRMTFTNGDIIHVRASGNAPELRCYCESGSKIAAEALLQQAMSLLAQQKP
ncbi:phosphohexomutase domain-containing protein [Marinomonas gallaica]|uniref:hypothetical protein n=1 Tax=Marinomonas gallaica TaxID=1806667 RepID=UPI0008330D46|nr:hypothetical protein [Marinomonas gallaica]